jgi:hypothetical protein
MSGLPPTPLLPAELHVTTEMTQIEGQLRLTMRFDGLADERLAQQLRLAILAFVQGTFNADLAPANPKQLQ